MEVARTEDLNSRGPKLRRLTFSRRKAVLEFSLESIRLNSPDRRTLFERRKGNTSQ